MKEKRYCFKINSFGQALEVIEFFNKSQIKPVLFFSFHLINGLKIDWLLEIKGMLLKQFEFKNFDIYVDVKKNYGLFINLVENKIDYIKVDANTNMLKKLNEIGKINKVLINPNFSILDLSKSLSILDELKKIKI